MPRVTVAPIPSWVPIDRLLGPGDWRASDGGTWSAQLERPDAADLSARLRGVCLAGAAVEVQVVPPLKRTLRRRALSDEAARRRQGAPGFTRPRARLDDEGRYSLTAESLALALGRAAAGRHVVDATCGCGGNTIGFARAGSEVVAVERHAGRLSMARHNARLYGVHDRVRFVAGDASAHVAGLGDDLLFVDPPWGADHNRAGLTLADLPALEPILRAGKDYRGIWLKLPPALDPRLLPGARPEAWFGDAPGDRRRIKFTLLRLAP